MSEEKLDTELTVDQIIDVLGPNEGATFLECMKAMDRIVRNPSTLVGNDALILAAQLAAHRTIIGVRAQHYKTAQKSIINSKRKNLLLTMYSSLEENINTLKILGRIEAKLL